MLPDGINENGVRLTFTSILGCWFNNEQESNNRSTECTQKTFTKPAEPVFAPPPLDMPGTVPNTCEYYFKAAIKYYTPGRATSISTTSGGPLAYSPYNGSFLGQTKLRFEMVLTDINGNQPSSWPAGYELVIVRANDHADMGSRVLESFDMTTKSLLMPTGDVVNLEIKNSNTVSVEAIVNSGASASKKWSVVGFLRKTSTGVICGKFGVNTLFSPMFITPPGALYYAISSYNAYVPDQMVYVP